MAENHSWKDALQSKPPPDTDSLQSTFPQLPDIGGSPLPTRKRTGSITTSQNPNLKRPSPEKKRQEPEKGHRSRSRSVFNLSLSSSTEGENTKLLDSLRDFGPPNIELTPEELAAHKRNYEAAERARAAITDKQVEALGIAADPSVFWEPAALPESVPKLKVRRVKKVRLDFFASLASAPELFMELAKQMAPKDLVKLYSISKDFHGTVEMYLSHVVRSCAQYQASEAVKLYPFRFYSDLCVRDPMGRKYLNRPWEVRIVPGLKWLQMVVHREKAVRDILACMARQGHRMPKGTANSIKKMWLVMDVSTSAGRASMMHGNWLTDQDLWNWQLFIVKLDMRFNDPVEGPGDDGLRKLMLGQRGLSPLWRLLKRTEFRDTFEVIRSSLRYRHRPRPQHQHLPLFNIPPEEIGIGHLEGWGKGRIHLLRPDELVIQESVRRSLSLKHHIMEMMLWGYVDTITGLDTPPTEEEKYMSDDEERPINPNWHYYKDGDSEDESEDGEGDKMMKDFARSKGKGKAREVDEPEETVEGFVGYNGKGKNRPVVGPIVPERTEEPEDMDMYDADLHDADVYDA